MDRVKVTHLLRLSHSLRATKETAIRSGPCSRPPQGGGRVTRRTASTTFLQRDTSAHPRALVQCVPSPENHGRPLFLVPPRRLPLLPVLGFVSSLLSFSTSSLLILHFLSPSPLPLLSSSSSSPLPLVSSSSSPPLPLLLHFLSSPPLPLFSSTSPLFSSTSSSSLGSRNLGRARSTPAHRRIHLRERGRRLFFFFFSFLHPPPRPCAHGCGRGCGRRDHFL